MHLFSCFSLAYSIHAHEQVITQSAPNAILVEEAIAQPADTFCKDAVEDNGNTNGAAGAQPRASAVGQKGERDREWRR